MEAAEDDFGPPPLKEAGRRRRVPRLKHGGRAPARTQLKNRLEPERNAAETWLEHGRTTQPHFSASQQRPPGVTDPDEAVTPLEDRPGHLPVSPFTPKCMQVLHNKPSSAFGRQTVDRRRIEGQCHGRAMRKPPSTKGPLSPSHRSPVPQPNQRQNDANIVIPGSPPSHSAG